MSKGKIALFSIVALLVLVLDRTTKLLALQGAHERNYGLLFGLLANSENRWLFVAIIILVLFFFVYVMRLGEVRRNNLLMLGLFLMMAGLIGNLLDRIFYGFVVDFIPLADWTTFNLSDVSIAAGSVIVLFYIFSSKKQLKLA